MVTFWLFSNSSVTNEAQKIKEWKSKIKNDKTNYWIEGDF